MLHKVLHFLCSVQCNLHHSPCHCCCWSSRWPCPLLLLLLRCSWPQVLDPGRNSSSSSSCCCCCASCPTLTCQRWQQKRTSSLSWTFSETKRLPRYKIQIDDRRKIVQFNYIHLSSLLSSELIERGKMFYSRAKLILLFIDTMQLLAVIKTTDSRGGNVNKMPLLRINWISSSSITYSWYKIGTWALLWLENYSSQIKRKEEEHSTLLSYNVQNIQQPNQQGKYCVNFLVAE